MNESTSNRRKYVEILKGSTTHNHYVAIRQMFDIKTKIVKNYYTPLITNFIR